jgi:hypothetical protein
MVVVKRQKMVNLCRIVQNDKNSSRLLLKDNKYIYRP